jgi:hypothetical protein
VSIQAFLHSSILTCEESNCSPFSVSTTYSGPVASSGSGAGRACGKGEDRRVKIELCDSLVEAAEAFNVKLRQKQRRGCL